MYLHNIAAGAEATSKGAGPAPACLPASTFAFNRCCTLKIHKKDSKSKSMRACIIGVMAALKKIKYWSRGEKATRKKLLIFSSVDASRAASVEAFFRAIVLARGLYCA